MNAIGFPKCSEILHIAFRNNKNSFIVFYITKDNVAGFVDKYGCNAEHTITITEDFAYVKYQHMTWHIRLNAFMVCEYDGWASYTEKDFRETYELMT